MIRQPHFTPERIATLGAALRAREGERFCQYRMDCVTLIAGVLAECGVTVPPLPESYSLSYGRHHDQSALMRWIYDLPDAHRLAEVDEPMPGDIALVRIHRAVHHMGIIGPQLDLWHVAPRVGVGRLSLDDSQLSHSIVTLRRIYAA